MGKLENNLVTENGFIFFGVHFLQILVFYLLIYGNSLSFLPAKNCSQVVVVV